MNTRCMILVLFCVVAVSAATSAAQSLEEGAMGGEMGGYTIITDLDDERLQDIAKYAVTEHNQQAGTNLEYQKLVRGEYQVVAGTNYRLVISAMFEGYARNFEAVVNETVGNGQDTSFLRGALVPSFSCFNVFTGRLYH